MSKPDENRIPSLDGLRAVSILIVVFSHIVIAYFQVDSFFLTGNLGVRIFFIISGFLIAGILLRETAETGRFKLLRFFFRRFFRIAPALFFYVGVISLYLLFINAPLWTLIIPLTYSTNYYFQLVPKELEHTWSLSIEEQFYVLFPIVLYFGRLRTFKFFLVSVVIATPLLRWVTYTTAQDDVFWRLAWNFHLNMDTIATGCLLAVFRERLHANSVYKKLLGSFPAAAAAFGVLFVCGLNYERNPALFFLVGITLMNIGIAFVVDWLITNERSVVGIVLNLSPVRFVGTLSYAIYLWQQPFTFRVSDRPWTDFPLNLVFVACFALVTYFLVERPLLDLRRNLEPKWFKRKKSANLSEENLSYGTNR